MSRHIAIFTSIRYTNRMKKHSWKFARFGGVTQLVFETAEDILQLRELDQKLWTVLSLPCSGLFFDEETARILDIDNDGYIRPPEILAAVDFLAASLNDVGVIMQAGESLELSAIKDEALAGTATWLLKKIGGGQNALTLSTVTDEAKALYEHETDEFAENDSNEERLKKVITLFVKANPDSTAEEIREKMKAEKAAYLERHNSLDTVLYGLKLEQMIKAVKTFDGIQKKVDDFFLRCKFLDYDKNSASVLNDHSDFMKTLANIEVDTANEALKSLPLAVPNTEKTLDLKAHINPAWISETNALYADIILPLCGELYSLNERDWKNICAKISDFKNFYAGEAVLSVSQLDADFLKTYNFDDPEMQQVIDERIRFEREKTNMHALKKLLLLRRDFFTLLNNYVSFYDFYAGKGSIFQAGVMFFDSREAHLCFSINSDARHATLDPISGAYLLYCDIFRGKEKQQVLCLLTNGASDNIVVGQNAVFYDRAGNDWNALVTKIVANPVSIREAFFAPYKKLVRLIEEQIAKRASSAEEKSNELIAQAATKTVNAPVESAQALPAKKMDLGTIALIGTAIGGISTLIGSILSVLFGLGYWVPLGLFGLLLLISGPSMILAGMKLRKRSFAPILQANGWAVNSSTRINIPLGTSLTKLAKLPANAKLAGLDPFAEKKTGKKVFIIVLIILLIAAAVFCWFYFVKAAGANPLKWFKTSGKETAMMLRTFHLRNSTGSFYL